MCPQPMSRSEPEPVDVIASTRPDLNRILEQQVEAGFPPELALDVVLHELVVRAVEATGASSAALALIRGDEMVCRAATGLHAPDLGVPLNTRDGLSGACLHTREPQLCLDAESDPRVDSAIAHRLGIRSILIVPVLDDDDLIGVLEVFSSEPGAFSEHEQTLLEASARDCARIRIAAADLGQRALAALALAPDQPLSRPEMAAPTLVLTGASARQTQPRYEIWTMVLGAIALLAAVALSFLVGFRTGWLFSPPSHAQLPVPASSAQAVPPVTPPPAPAPKSAALTSASASTSKVQSASSQDELVVYDHGKVIFRMRPVNKPSGPNPVVDASESSRIAPSAGVWLAPDQSERLLRNRIEPQYPADALAERRAGQVVLEVQVAADGSVASIRTISGDPVLAAAAADAVRQWRYQPFVQNERPSPFQTEVTLKFALPN